MLLCHTLKLKSELLLNHYLANAAVLHADNLDATMVLVNNLLSVESVTTLDVLVVSVELNDACGNVSYAPTTTRNRLKSTNATNINDALKDMNGRTNTDSLKASAERISGYTFKTAAPAAYYAYYYNHNTFSTGTEHFGWFLPGLGELSLLFANRLEVNATLVKLSKKNSSIKTLRNGGSSWTINYWSSTRYAGAGAAWGIFGTHYVWYHYADWGACVRAIASF